MIAADMEPYKAHLRYEVPYADTDRMGMVYYANYLVFFERTRTRLLDEVGYPYPEMETDGYGLPVIEAHVQYHKPATYGEFLDFFAWSDSARGTRLRVNCEVRRDGELLASGYTVHACIDLQTKRPVRLPSRLLACYTDVGLVRNQKEN